MVYMILLRKWSRFFGSYFCGTGDGPYLAYIY